MPSFLESLLPRPRKCSRGGGEFAIGSSGTVRFEGAEADVRPARDRLRAALGAGWRFLPSASPDLLFRLVPEVAGPQSYRLRIERSGVRAEAEDRAGLFYAAVTLAQLLRLSKGLLPVCEIEDAPDFPVRGAMLDISRDKVPTMATLFWLTERLADLKVNQFQLYTEHAFAYAGHEEVWRDASPMTGAEIRELDAFCRARCIELVPNQNSFGHLERWLVRPRYNGLAELPKGGAPLPWGGVHEKPTSLCPSDPRCGEFLAGLYDDLLPNFTSRLFNVGCDETFDLRGPGRSRERVAREGEGRVYLDFLKKIHALVAARGRTMAFWGDIIICHPELISELPRDAVALEWGYEAGHPFDAHGARFAASGIPFYVCPGTSSWNSLAGRTANMLANVRLAAENGRRHGACGLLMTDWGDGGHWQPLAVSLAGFGVGACAAWGVDANRDVDAAEAADACGSGGGGAALAALGDVYRLCGALRGNGTELFQLLFRPRAKPLLAGVTPETLRAVLTRVDEVVAAAPRAESIAARETEQVARLLRTACHRGLVLLGVGHVAGLVSELDALAESHAEVWRLRNREGGLRDSIARLDPVRAECAG